MRKTLDTLYLVSGVAAAAFLAAIAVAVLIQVAFNALDRLAVALTGEAVGLTLPSYAEFTGYFLAAASFLALAYTMKAGGHIRVSLVLQRLPLRARWASELFSAALGALFAGYFTFWTAALAIDSFGFGDVSPGVVPVPLWIPQSSLAVGLGVLTVALVDELAILWRTGAAARDAADETDMSR